MHVQLEHAAWPRNRCNSSGFCWNSLRRVFLAEKLGNSMTIKSFSVLTFRVAHVSRRQELCRLFVSRKLWHDSLSVSNSSTQSVSNMMFVGGAMVKSSSSPGLSGKRAGSDSHYSLLWKFSAFGCPGGTGGGKRHPASAKRGAGGFAEGWEYSDISWDFRTWMGTWTSIP